MIVETGHYALVLALALAIVNSILPLWGSITQDERLMAVAPPVAIAGFGLVAYAYFALTVAHAASDFSLLNVVDVFFDSGTVIMGEANRSAIEIARGALG
jgi:cytochrome c-type biogenesis protein CcmF